VLLFLTLIAAIGCGSGSSSQASQSSPGGSNKSAPTIVFTAQPTTINSGSSTTLSWNASNATSVTIAGVGTFAATGSVSVKPTATTTYSATASGPDGNKKTSIVVNVVPVSGGTSVPTITLSAQPGTVINWDPATLSWTSTNATSVTIAGVGTFGASGSTTVTPSATTTYAATATGSVGAANATATVTVQPGVPQFGHVFLLLEENHSYSEVIGSSSMPYLNSLAQQYGLATQYFADTHPSIGNYFMLTTGQIITNDDYYTGTVSDDNFVRHFISAGISWKSYAEDLPSVGYIGGDTGNYMQHHNPFTYFTDVVNSSTELNNLVPFTQFATDLANNQLPQFSFIVPNIQDDAHNGTLAQADSWLSTNIAPLIASSTFQQDGLLIIVFDESVDTDTAHGGGQVAMVMISQKMNKAYQSTTFYQHESTCELVLQALGQTSFPGACQGAPQMSEFF
jgi:phosphatidylinositol-3-phosphatase